ncbi:ribonuclease J [Rhizobiales bacterium GAS113]|jgi:ribonuclease J|nr:ribonuclease J [Rhizobiales bacterium GAS113]
MSDTSSDLIFVPLGGLGEIGMNASAYGYGPPGKRKWLLVDCGVSFAGEEAPGIDLVLPDLSFIEKERKNLVGIIITHAHEDHIGALAALWPRLGADVHATRFAVDLLEARRLGEPGAPKVPLKVHAPGAPFDVGPFNVEFIPVAHSIPESMALAIRTPAGLVLHTGDWKIDPHPVVGRPTDEARLRALGDEGVLALICDSTNIVRGGSSPSEADVAKTMRSLIAEAPQRVAVTIFASNVARIRAVAEAAREARREVVIVGRAMQRVVEVAGECGYLDDLPPFHGPEAYAHLDRQRVVALLTGSQGEPRAALSRIATDDHPAITFSPGDRVIFSSRTIPGNEKPVSRIINFLIRQGVELITDRTHLVHVSGHPRRDEVRQMYQWVRPKIAIPAHGEALHLSEHAAFARELGVPQVLTAYDGDIVRLAPGDAAIAGKAKAGKLYQDGDLLISTEDEAIRERRKLAIAGIVSVAFAVNARGEIAGEVEIEASGLPQSTREGGSILDLLLDAVLRCVNGLPRPRRRDADFVENAVNRAVRSAVNGMWGKKPKVHVLVVSV